MAGNHRRHSSMDTLGWMYTNRAREDPPPAVARSNSTRGSSFRRDQGLLKRQSSIRFNPGEYFAGFTGCFTRGSSFSRDEGPVSQRPILANRSPGEPGASRPRRSRSRSISLGNFEFDLGTLRFKEKPGDTLAVRAVELNRQSATHKQRVVQPGGRWVMEDDAEYFLKPPAWKQALRKLRAEAKRHVHPVRELSPGEDYDEESYEKNFDDGEGDEFGIKARMMHSQLLTRLHSQRFDGEGGKILKTTSVPVVMTASRAPIWERRCAGRPIAKLELTRSI